MTTDVDLLVIGGGINGCGIARDAAGRGLRVLLAEMNDLAGATSSASTKLIHGGLRYLEYYEFRLVREALIEREILLKAAPHIIWPMRFVLPHHKGLRPAWLLRLGLWLYDHLGGRKILPATTTVDLQDGPFGKPLKPLYSKGFEYSDCWVQDSRLVALNARAAKNHGAEILTRTKVVQAVRRDGHWNVTLKDTESGHERHVTASALVNAAGPWVSSLLSETFGFNEKSHVRLVKGSHIVVPKLFDHDRCYIFQNSDGRIVFTIPYENDFTLIGTTDVDFKDDPAEVEITEEEKAYLCAAVSEYFREPVTPNDVVYTYSGVRPLYDDGASDAKAATRDYVLELEDENGQAPLLNVFGGKITTYRRLAEHALEKFGERLPTTRGSWTADAPLPGGDFPVSDFGELLSQLENDYPWLDKAHLHRLLRAYGVDTWPLLNGLNDQEALGRHFGADLYEAEVVWLMENEWARQAADVLWRRSKLGLRLSKEQAAALDAWMQERINSGA